MVYVYTSFALHHTKPPLALHVGIYMIWICIVPMRLGGWQECRPVSAEMPQRTLMSGPPRAAGLLHRQPVRPSDILGRQLLQQYSQERRVLRAGATSAPNNV